MQVSQGRGTVKSQNKRESGIKTVGVLPWGVHLCLFYNTKQELLEILVPYFRAGLENNEACLCIVPVPLSKKEVEAAMRKSVPGFDGYLKSGQMEIIPSARWYLPDGVFDEQKVLSAFTSKYAQDLEKGYNGLRTSGDTSWQVRDWKAFISYKEKFTNLVADHRWIALGCYYSDKYGASEFMTAIREHRYILVKKSGEWTLENNGHRGSQPVMDKLKKELKCLYSITDIIEKSDSTSNEIYQEIADLLPQGWQYPELARARIKIRDMEFKSANYGKTRWKQTADIRVYGAGVGKLEIGYLKMLPGLSEPSSREDRHFIDNVAKRLGHFTERKLAGETSRAAMDVSPSIIAVLDKNGILVDVNKKMAAKFGKLPKDIIGVYSWGLLPPELAKSRSKYFDEVVRTGQGCRFEDENQGACFDNIYNPIFDEHGQVTKVAVHVTDITDRKQVNEAQRVGEQRYEKFFQSIKDAMFIINRQGEHLYCNEALTRMLGYSREEFLNLTRVDIVHPDFHYKLRENREHVWAGETITGESAYCSKDGRKIPVEFIACGMEYHGEPVLLVMAYETSGQKQVRGNQEMISVPVSERAVTPVQDKFIRLGFEGLGNNETFELLLSLVSSPEETAQLAKLCEECFGSFSKLLAASPQKLEECGFPASFIFGIRMMHELPAHVLKQKIIEKPVFDCSEDLFNYLYYYMRDLDEEVFKVIYLNNRSQIIDAVILFTGTYDNISIRPREIVESAIKQRASSLIFVHNHPSGDPGPSKSDKQLTRDLVFMGYILQIKVVDHIIIGANKYYSFADEGLIQKYEDNFLDMKIKAVFDGKRNKFWRKPSVPALPVGEIVRDKGRYLQQV